MIATMKNDRNGVSEKKVARIRIEHNGDYANVSVWQYKRYPQIIVTISGEHYPSECIFSSSFGKLEFSGGIFVGGKDFTILVKNGRLFVR